MLLKDTITLLTCVIGVVLFGTVVIVHGPKWSLHGQSSYRSFKADFLRDDGFYDVHWQGNFLVWQDSQHYHYRSKTELQEIFKNKTVVFIGDSLMRRLAQVFVLTMTADTFTIPELMKDVGGHKRREYNIDLDKKSIKVISIWAPCLSELEAVEQHVNNADLTIYAAAFHDSAVNDNCKSPKVNPTDTLVQLSKKHESFFYMTLAMPVENPKKFDFKSHAKFYGNVRQAKSIKLIDTERMFEGRDTGPNRIKGNTHMHLGPEARLAEVQILGNFARGLLSFDK